jgi:hypothetical protein
MGVSNVQASSKYRDLEESSSRFISEETQASSKYRDLEESSLRFIRD